jgi:hypothetical protein
MRSSEPPRVAAWLLEHLVTGRMKDALAGDLAEEFVRRGRAWYWRQVVLSIVAGFFRQIRDAWVSIAYSIAWFFAGGELLARLNLWLFAGAPREAWWVGLPWPWSLIVEVAREVWFGIVPLVLGLSIYLLIARRFGLRCFFAAVLAALAAITISDVALTFLRGNGYRLSWAVPAMADTATLILAIWIAQTAEPRAPQPEGGPLAS